MAESPFLGKSAPRPQFLLNLALSLLVAVGVQAASPWEKEIAAFEAMDRTNPPPTGAVLFVGSSTIRLWTTLAEDLPGLRVIRRGFGGSQIADSTAFADRIIIPYRPSMVVVYAGDNDVAAGKTAPQVLADFQALVHKVHAALPQARIVFLSIKPSLARWAKVGIIRQANSLVRDFTQTDPRLTYIDLFSPMLNRDGNPRGELLRADGLHLNRAGYKLWAQTVRPYLQPGKSSGPSANPTNP